MVLAVGGLVQPTRLHSGESAPPNLTTDVIFPASPILLRRRSTKQWNACAWALRGGSGAPASDFFGDGRMFAGGGFADSSAVARPGTVGDAPIAIDAQGVAHRHEVNSCRPVIKVQGVEGLVPRKTKAAIQNAHDIEPPIVTGVSVNLQHPAHVPLGGTVAGGDTWFPPHHDAQLHETNHDPPDDAGARQELGASTGRIGGRRKRRVSLSHNSPDNYFKTVLSLDPTDVDMMCEYGEMLAREGPSRAVVMCNT